ncbi:MAG: hypothetical protein PHH70_01830 [Candidatus Gracilibacteria bacterium]|nr:hypothetical protein [Candidatus Gracilibacteria bacterium]
MRSSWRRRGASIQSLGIVIRRINRQRFANLVKSIQFFPSAIAGGFTVASTRNDVAVKVDKSLLPCKYPTSATNVTSDGNNTYLYRSRYQFGTNQWILDTRQFSTSVPTEQVCRDVEKGVERKVSRISNENLPNNIVYLGDTANPKVESLVTSAVEALVRGESVEYYTDQLVGYGIPSATIANIKELAYQRRYGVATHDLLDFMDPIEPYIWVGAAILTGTEAVPLVLSGMRLLVGATTGSVVFITAAGPAALMVAKYQASLQGLIKFSSQEIDAIQKLTPASINISRLSNMGNIFLKIQDKAGKMYWLQKGNISLPNVNSTGFQKIFIDIKAGETLTRYEQLKNNGLVQSFMQKTFGKAMSEPKDLLKLIEHIVKNGEIFIDPKKPNDLPAKIFDIGGRFLKVPVFDNGAIHNITF